MAQRVVKKLKVPEECCESRETFADGNMSYDFAECILLTLPGEVLQKIFAHLSFPSIVNIRKLGFRKLAECTFYKEADFSQCNRIRPEVLEAFFCMHSVQQITKINLNGVFFVSSKILKTSIMKCKNLRVLSVEECGLSLRQIVDICRSCPQLEELCFSISIYNPPEISEKCPSVRKLYLSLVFQPCVNCSLQDYLEIFPNVRIVYLNHSHYYYLCLPYNNDCVQLKEVVNYRNDALLVNLIRGMENGGSNFEETSINQLLYLWTTDNYEVPACSFKDSLDQQFWTLGKDLPSSLVPSLGLNMREKTAQDFIKIAKKTTFKKLEHLAINGFDFGSYQHNKLIIDSIPEILMNSYNISVLNISIIHFENALPLSCLHSMKSLKILSLPGCAISGNMLRDQKKDIEDLVINCKKVQKFSLTGCKDCFCGLDDDDLAPIHKWKGLISLSFIGITTLGMYYFLVQVANSCPDFQSLEIIQNSVNLTCRYIPNIIRLLRKSPKLKFLRIIDLELYPMDSIFWTAVKSARNLEGLCLATTSTMPAVAGKILEAIGQLPYLHLFHLQIHKEYCYTLQPKIKELMIQHGIQNASINVESCAGSSRLLCKELHFVI